MAGLEEWIAFEARYAARTMTHAISATHLVKERAGFGQRVVPRPGSVLASPVPASYDPDPDYFFHWFRDSAIVIDALRVGLADGFADHSARGRFREFVEFSLSLFSLDGQDFLQNTDFKTRVQPWFLQYVRSDDEIASVKGDRVSGDTRVNADGTIDFIRWSRPQADGPALRLLALLRWWNHIPSSESELRASMRRLIEADVAYTMSRAGQSSYDIWEEESGFHYYTLLVQAQALAESADWNAAIERRDRARELRAASDRIVSLLDSYWDKGRGFYRSRSGAEGIRDKDLDIAVILGIIHAGRPDGSHSVLDPHAQATLVVLEEHFDAEYAINHNRPRNRGPALGRYANDSYYSGGAYFFATLAAAEFYFRLAVALQSGAVMPITPENLGFRLQLVGTSAALSGNEFAEAAIRTGDAILEMVRAHTPAGGELSEQFDRTTGAQVSAKHLSWSYAAFLTTISHRLRCTRATGTDS